MSSAFDISVRHPGAGFNEKQVAQGGMHVEGHGHNRFNHILPIWPNMPHAVTPGNIGGDHAPATLHFLFGGA